MPLLLNTSIPSHHILVGACHVSHSLRALKHVADYYKFRGSRSLTVLEHG